MNGSHEFTIRGYSLTKGIGHGKYISSDSFNAGGREWAVYFYPDGKNIEDDSTYVSVFVVVTSDGPELNMLFELTLVDQSGNEKHKVFRSSEMSGYTMKYTGSMWGYKRFYKRDLLETSDYLKDDCLKINCSLRMVGSPRDVPVLHSVQVLHQDIGSNIGE